MIITQKVYKSIRPPAGKADHTEWDEGTPCFGIRFRNGGPGTWIIIYKLHGRDVRLPLGKVAVMDYNTAHAEALRQFKLLGDDKNPRIERAKVKAKTSVLFKDRIDDMLAEMAASKLADSYCDEVERTLNRCEALHLFACSDIDRSLIATELDKISDQYGPTARDRARAHLSKYFNWLGGKGVIDHNPVSRTTKSVAPKQSRGEKGRKKPFAKEEMIAFWNACLENDDYSDIVKLLILTGCRRTEIGDLQKSEIDRDAKMIKLPEGYDVRRTKNREAHWIPLSPTAFAIIEKRMDTSKGDFLFGRTVAAGFSGWSKAKTEMTARCGIKRKWHHHWFRDTMHTWMGNDLKIAPHIREAQLNHISSVESGKQGIGGVYDHAAYLEERTAALAAYDELLMGLVRPRPDLHLVKSA